MNAQEKAHCEHIIRIAQSLHEQNMMPGHQGSLSIKLFDDYILITPAGFSKSRLKSSEIAIMDSKGNSMVGTLSEEKNLHLAVYNKNPNAKAVIHAHPVAVSAWCIARPSDKELPTECLPETFISLGKVPILPYTRICDSRESLESNSFLQQLSCCVFARNGALSWGATLEEAHCQMEVLEQGAQILTQALRMGGVNSLTRNDIDYLQSIRALKNSSKFYS